MAKIDVKHLVAKQEDEAKGFVLAKAIKVAPSPESSDAVMWADGEVAESDKGFKQGSKIQIDGDDYSLENQGKLLGHKVEGKKLVANGNDVAPFFGIGFVGVKRVKGVNVYIAKWYHKIQFGEPSDDFETKKENLEFGSSTIEGGMYLDSNKDWKTEEEFTTEAEAIAMIDELGGIAKSTPEA